MNPVELYVETSAVLSWLLDQNRGDEAYRALTQATYVYTSDLTLIECERALHRAAVTGELDETTAASVRAAIETAAAHWNVCSMDAEVVAGSRRRFPHEPVRALDAIHLSTAVFVRNLAPEVRVLSFDDRVRRNAEALGFDVAA